MQFLHSYNSNPVFIVVPSHPNFFVHFADYQIESSRDVTGVTQGADVRLMAFADDTSLQLTYTRQYHQGNEMLPRSHNYRELDNILLLISRMQKREGKTRVRGWKETGRGINLKTTNSDFH